MARGKELTPDQRAYICELASINWSARQIWRKHPEWPLGTIRYTIRKASMRGEDCKSLPRSGRPAKVTQEHRDRVMELLTKDPDMRTKDLFKALNCEVGGRSVRHIIAQLGGRRKFHASGTATAGSAENTEEEDVPAFAGDGNHGLAEEPAALNEAIAVDPVLVPTIDVNSSARHEKSYDKHEDPVGD